MPLTVIRRPIVSSGGTDFRFNSIALPTIYEFERRDFTWNQVNTNGGKVQAQFNGINLTTSFAIGDEIYVKALAGSPYDGFTTVTAVAFSGGNTLVTVDINYVSTSTSGFINNETLRAGYYVQVRFYDTDDDLLTDAIQEESPTAEGEIIVDISEFSKSFLSPDFQNIAPSFTITPDILAAKEIYIAYREVWIGSQELETADSANPIFIVLGAQQLPLANGSNYGITSSRYINVPDSVVAKFLRVASVVNVWRDWPFTISFLMQGAEVADEFTIQINSGEQESISVVVTDNMYRANIGGITWDSIGDSMALTINSAALGGQIVETKTLSVIDPCANPVMLIFRNHLGGDVWQMFDYNQEYEYINDNGTKVKRMMLSTSGLTSDQWDELNDIVTYGAELKENIVEILPTTNKTKSRAYQQVYKVDQDGTMTGVIAIPTRNFTMTKKFKHTFEIEIEFPEHFLP